MNGDGAGPMMATHPHGTFQREQILKGVRAFAVLTVGGAGLLFAVTVRQETFHALRTLSLGFIALAFLGSILDLVIGAIRYQIFLRRLDPDSSLWLPIRADLANRFTGAVTPSQTGGGPAQVFILWRGGVPIPEALSFLAINFMSTLVFFLMAGGFTAFVFRERVPAGAVEALLTYGFLAFAVMALVFVVVLLRPDLIAWPCRVLVGRIDQAREGWVGRLRRLGHWTVRSLGGYRDACTLFIRRTPILLVQSFLLTVLLYVNKFTVAYFVMRGLGVEGPYLEVVAVQTLLQLILYVAPTPGGSGIAEVTTAALMALLVPDHLLAPFTIGFRFFLLYLPAAVGAFVLMRALKSRTGDGTTAPGRVRRALQVLSAVGLLLLVPRLAVHGQAIPDRSATELRIERVEMSPIEAIEEIDVAWDPVLGLLERARQAAVLGRKLEDDDDAREAFLVSEHLARQAVAMEPGSAEGCYVLAVALGQRIELEGARTGIRLAGEALAEAERAVTLDPGHAGAHHVLGRLHAGTMRTSRIVRFLAKQLLGGDMLDRASWETAERHFVTARDLAPDLIAPHLELGVLYRDTNRPELARRELLRVLELPPVMEEDEELILRAGRLLEEMTRGRP